MRLRSSSLRYCCAPTVAPLDPPVTQRYPGPLTSTGREHLPSITTITEVRMPTFNDPLADAREAAEAIRGLAHATQHVENPEVLYPVVGELMATTRNMSQVLDQLARAHQRHTGRAMTDAGDREQGSQLTFEAAAALHEAAGHVGQADTVLDRASNRAGRIAWRPDEAPERWISVVFFQGEEAEPVLDIIDRQGTDAAVEYLAGWDMADETEDDALENGYVYDVPPQSGMDKVATRDVYALTYNHQLGYVGLTRPMNVMPDPVLLHLEAPEPAPLAAEAPRAESPAREERQGRHRGPEQAAESSWFRPDAINDIEQSRGLSL
ncbi:hypothetical protein ACTXKH_07745 [Brachybacterium tyrofermentans]|uniref:hypothetical protein n=2 Tax=Brachybacterium tyrofermentans TaxID=47848 RepID=UPI003F8E26FC